MPYCTRCGREIKEGERCTCQDQDFDIKAPNLQDLKGSNLVDTFFGFAEQAIDPKDKFERGMKIVPENVTPDEGEITIRQYDFCRLRSRLKFMFAEGRLQVTNKRLIFRAKGTSLTGSTILQQEFNIAELGGFQVNRNFRFMVLDMILGLLLTAFFGTLGALPANGAGDSGLLLLLVYILGAVIMAATLFLGRHHLLKACAAAMALSMMAPPVALLYLGSRSNFAMGVVFFLAMIPALLAAAQYIVSLFLFAFKPNLEFKVQAKGGEGVMYIRHKAKQFLVQQNLDHVFTGYNEVLPAPDTDRVIREIEAVVSDIQKLGDLAIEKWKED